MRRGRQEPTNNDQRKNAECPKHRLIYGSTFSTQKQAEEKKDRPRHNKRISGHGTTARLHRWCKLGESRRHRGRAKRGLRIIGFFWFKSFSKFLEIFPEFFISMVAGGFVLGVYKSL